ncbi:MAG: hypothetical protein AB1523_11965 [Bacillota bacterium]
MLFSIESQSYIRDIPHRKEFEIWRSRLTDEEYQAIVDELNNRIESGEIHTSSWIPGSDWTGTVFQPIYEKACRYDKEAAAKFFGLIVWAVLLEHDDVWAFGRYEKDGVSIEGLTYFKLSRIP